MSDQKKTTFQSKVDSESSFEIISSITGEEISRNGKEVRLLLGLLQPLTQLHAWWHCLAGYATYLNIQVQNNNDQKGMDFFLLNKITLFQRSQ